MLAAWVNKRAGALARGCALATWGLSARPSAASPRWYYTGKEPRAAAARPTGPEAACGAVVGLL
eukprot:9240481-Alexandrium_andersonii.AAC.1